MQAYAAVYERNRVYRRLQKVFGGRRILRIATKGGVSRGMGDPALFHIRLRFGGLRNRGVCTGAGVAGDAER